MLNEFQVTLRLYEASNYTTQTTFWRLRSTITRIFKNFRNKHKSKVTTKDVKTTPFQWLTPILILVKIRPHGQSVRSGVKKYFDTRAMYLRNVRLVYVPFWDLTFVFKTILLQVMATSNNLFTMAINPGNETFFSHIATNVYIYISLGTCPRLVSTLMAKYDPHGVFYTFLVGLFVAYIALQM